LVHKSHGSITLQFTGFLIAVILITFYKIEKFAQTHELLELVNYGNFLPNKKAALAGGLLCLSYGG